MIKIDKGYPIPPRTGRGREPKYPWADMVVGDSFLMTSPKSISGASSGASAAGKRLGMRFSVRTEGDAYRVWRVE